MPYPFAHVCRYEEQPPMPREMARLAELCDPIPAKLAVVDQGGVVLLFDLMGALPPSTTTDGRAGGGLLMASPNCPAPFGGPVLRREAADRGCSSK